IAGPCCHATGRSCLVGWRPLRYRPAIGDMTTAGTHGTLADRTVALGRALQAAGVNVSLSEIIDAARATTEIDIARRTELHAALRATLVKQARHYPTFEWAFDRYFPARLVRHDSDTDEEGALAESDID